MTEHENIGNQDADGQDAELRGEDPQSAEPEAKRGAERRRRGVLIASLSAAAILLAAGIFTGVTLMNMNNGADARDGSENTDAGGGTSEAQGSGGSGAEGGSGSESADSGHGTADGLRSDASQVLPKAMSGQEAIDALGDDIEIVAERNGMSVDQLEETLLKNPSAKVSKNGFLMLP